MENIKLEQVVELREITDYLADLGKRCGQNCLSINEIIKGINDNFRGY